MELKRLLYILLILLFFTSCKTTSTIITSKNKAERNGIYSPYPNKRATTSVTPARTIHNTNTSSHSTAKSSRKNKEPRKTHSTLLKDNEIEEDYTVDNDEDVSYLVKQLINTAMEYSGVRYRFGGTTNEGMDCSGLIFTTFNTFDIKMPRTSIDLSKKGIKLKNSEIKKGDLVFFRTNPRKKQINHVGIVVDVHNDEVKFIHASVQRGVIVSSTKEAYYKNTFVQANRVLN